MTPPTPHRVPTALTIAGSDSGGGAGVQADIRAFQAFGVYPNVAITALTAQNPRKVRHVEAAGVDMVRSQIETILCAFTVKAAKTGMLYSAEIVEVVRQTLERRDFPLIVDPVAVSTSGKRLLTPDGADALAERLFPIADWVTPNVPEAELFLNIAIRSESDAARAAAIFSEKWRVGCVLKGGHLGGDLATDWISYKGETRVISSPRVALPDLIVAHGTGCSFSAAFTANLALGKSWETALNAAKAYVYDALIERVIVGPGLEAMFKCRPSGDGD